MTNTTYLYSEFVNTKMGDAYRLFPFGKVVKGGKARMITPEYAAKFKLPHFKPPIKLGSHEDATPAGGHIVGLEVRADGLYAIPEWNDQGIKALADGAYRYQSPEIIWDDGGLEDPTSGGYITGPLVLGDAMLHTPHLGEAAAMYTAVQPINDKENDMTEETISVPKTFWDKFVAPLLGKSNDQPEPRQEPEGVKPDVYAAVEKERDDYKAKFEAREKADKENALKTELIAKLQNKDDFGMSYVELKAADEAATMMAGMTPEQREWCMRNFRAFVAQIDTTKLLGEKGSEGQSAEDPKLAFNALVLKYAAENKIGYNQAFDIVKADKPELFTAWAVKEK